MRILPFGVLRIPGEVWDFGTRILVGSDDTFTPESPKGKAPGRPSALKAPGLASPRLSRARASGGAGPGISAFQGSFVACGAGCLDPKPLEQQRREGVEGLGLKEVHDPSRGMVWQGLI